MPTEITLNPLTEGIVKQQMNSKNTYNNLLNFVYLKL